MCALDFTIHGNESYGRIIVYDSFFDRFILLVIEKKVSNKFFLRDIYLVTTELFLSMDLFFIAT